jgi:tripartite-type tricarboxylate transporter receptor subunit TctC
MSLRKTIVVSFLGFAAAVLTAACPAQSAKYPDKPIRFIVPYPAGAGNDILARMVSREMSEHFGQAVIVDNRAGAAGSIGLQILARSAPDGYTIGIADTGPLAINPSLYPQLPYDPRKDFTPISALATFQYMLVVNPTVSANTVAELIDLAKKRPNTLNYASVGSGSVVHLATELFRQTAGIDIVHVPYKASPDALQSVAANQTQVMFVNVQAATALVNAGKLRALAVVGDRRSPVFPTLPTMAESGFPSYDFKTWFGIVAPANVPAPIVMALNAEINRILLLPSFKQGLVAMGGVEGTGGTPQQFGRLIKSDIDAWGALVRKTGAKVD